MSRSRPAHSSPAELPLTAPASWLGNWFTGARREGLLAHLRPEAWHTLSALLSFTTRDGRRLFTVEQLAVALGSNREGAEARLADLLSCRWQAAPLLTLETDPEGEVVGAELAPLELLARVQPSPESRSLGSGVDLVTPSARNVPDVVPLPAAPRKSSATDLPDALAVVGLNAFQIDWLQQRFPEERILRQLEWLPTRAAYNPPALLIRAIEQDWDPPREEP